MVSAVLCKSLAFVWTFLVGYLTIPLFWTENVYSEQVYIERMSPIFLWYKNSLLRHGLESQKRVWTLDFWIVSGLLETTRKFRNKLNTYFYERKMRLEGTTVGFCDVKWCVTRLDIKLVKNVLVMMNLVNLTGFKGPSTHTSCWVCKSVSNMVCLRRGESPWIWAATCKSWGHRLNKVETATIASSSYYHTFFNWEPKYAFPSLSCSCQELHHSKQWTK